MPVLSNLKVGRGISGIVQDQMPIFVYVESILPFSRNSYAAGALRAGRTLNSLLALWSRLPLFASRNPKAMWKDSATAFWWLWRCFQAVKFLPIRSYSQWRFWRSQRHLSRFPRLSLLPLPLLWLRQLPVLQAALLLPLFEPPKLTLQPQLAQTF